jgi:hypothetical protein
MFQINSTQEPCSKCLKKYNSDLTNWTPCKNCPWVTKKSPTLKQEKEKLSSEKICMECQELLNFLEPEKDKYLCGKVKCLRSYIERKSEKDKD